MEKKIREDIYRCEWCGDPFDNKKDLVDHRKKRHSDYGAHDTVSKLNYKLMMKERKEKKDIKEEAERSYVPAPISESEVRKIMEGDLSNLTSMEILMRLDQGDEWREQIKLLDLARKFGIMHREDIETTDGIRIGYKWNFMKECVKEEEKLEEKIKYDTGKKVDYNKEVNKLYGIKKRYSPKEIKKRRYSDL